MIDCFYFSLATFTSVDSGDIFPIGYSILLSCLEMILGVTMMGVWTATLKRWTSIPRYMYPIIPTRYDSVAEDHLVLTKSGEGMTTKKEASLISSVSIISGSGDVLGYTPFL